MCKGVYEQINDFCVNQPQLSLREEDQYYKLTGKYIYSLSYSKAIFEGAKEVELYIPKAFPKVPIELKCKKYPEDFNHVYPNGNVCLATIGEIQFFLSDSPTVEEFIEHFINPFFFLHWSILRNTMRFHLVNELMVHRDYCLSIKKSGI